jgi:hypothetical protein
LFTGKKCQPPYSRFSTGIIHWGNLLNYGELVSEAIKSRGVTELPDFIRLVKTDSSIPFKITFTRDLFFPGLKGQDKTARMVQAYVFGTAAEPLVPNRVLIAELALHLLCHDSTLLSFV